MAETLITIIGLLLIFGAGSIFMSLIVEKHETYGMIPEENLKSEKIEEMLYEDLVFSDELLDDE